MDAETIRYDIDLNGTPELVRVLDRSRDNLNRPDGYQLKDGANVDTAASYGYDPAGRLNRVHPAFPLPTSPAPSAFNYGYHLDTYGLLQTVTSPVDLVVTNTYEPTRDALESKQNKVGNVIPSGYTYEVNKIGQRTKLTTGFALGSGIPANPGDIFWGYDPLGQVTKADHTVTSLDRAYAFDDIGNRLKSAEGTTDPNDSSATAYTPNALNQYSSINQPPTTILSPLYDLDGNATNYPLPTNPNTNSILAWDGENRLISVNSTTTYRYDASSRRVATLPTSGPATLVLYDGWNPIASYTGTTLTLTKTNLWGLDLSTTTQGAGGVGGLLCVSFNSQPSTLNYYPTYDGNGNISEYLDSTGTPVAHYEYDPFGKTTIASGPQALEFTHRFSTKPIDEETGLYYYGYRYYDPVLGRWPSKDPIGERGGANLYGMVGNNPVMLIDINGTHFFWMHFAGSDSEYDRKISEKATDAINEHKKILLRLKKLLVRSTNLT